MGSICIDIEEVSEPIAHAWRAADAGRNREADLHFQCALRIDQTIHARIEYAEFLADCVSIESAIDQLKTCLNISRNSQRADDSVLACNRLAALYRELGNAPQAERYQQFAISAETRNGDAHASSLHCASTLGFARDLIQKREFEPAKFLLISLSQSNDAIANQARISLAGVYLQEQEFTAAHILLDQVSQWLTGRTEISQLIQTLKLRSQAYVAEENFVAAEESLAEAIKLAENNARSSRFLPSLKLSRSNLARQMSVLCQKAEWN